jgi:hypothetical protein
MILNNVDFMKDIQIIIIDYLFQYEPKERTTYFEDAFNESFPNKEYKPTILAEQREKENGFEN